MQSISTKKIAAVAPTPQYSYEVPAKGGLDEAFGKQITLQLENVEISLTQRIEALEQGLIKVGQKQSESPSKTA